MSFIPQTLGVVLAAIVLWHVLKTEEMVEKMAERPLCGSRRSAGPSKRRDESGDGDGVA